MNEKDFMANKIIDDGVAIFISQYRFVDWHKYKIVECPSGPTLDERLINLEVLIAEFKAISPNLEFSLKRLSFLLAVVEDILADIQKDGTNPVDRNLY